MKRPKLRKASKRVSCSMKYRIRKNVANYNRKVRRDAKKNGGIKHKPKDPGIPNSLPFKEEILQEAEMRKQRAEEERQRQKEQRHLEVNKRRNLESLQKDALDRQKNFEKKEATLTRMSVNPEFGTSKETSRKAYYKEFRKVVDNADVIVEVLDARDPLGCRCLEMEKTVLDSGAKRIVLLLNKIDLVPKENVEDWLKYLRNEFPTVAFKASTQSQANLARCKASVKQIHDQALSNINQCIGADSLLKLLSNYCRHNDVKTSITVGVVGFPNVGKSSVINSLKRTKACNVGATPGVTKTMQEVTLNKKIKILDCPGIVMATGSNPMAVILRNCVKVETLDDPVSPVAAILSRCDKQQMMMRYNLANYENVDQFLDMLARRKGKLRKGGIPNIDDAAKFILHDWNSGRISYYTHPPQSKTSSHVSAKIVEKMAEEFDWDCLEEDNLNAVAMVRGTPSQAHSVLFNSAGPMDMETASAVESDEDLLDDAEDAKNMQVDEEVKPAELGDIKINMKMAKKRSEKSGQKKTDPSSVTALEDIIASGSNIQANHHVKALMKQNKKKRKRADKLSDKLGDNLLSAMNLSTEPDDYDFDTDLQL